MSLLDEENENKENLLKNLKKDVKLIIELSVTCRFINEDNSSFNSLCASIEACLRHGLKKDLFKKTTTYNLLLKSSKDCEEAKKVVDICNHLESNYLTYLNQKDKFNDSFSDANSSQHENFNAYKTFSDYNSYLSLTSSPLNQTSSKKHLNIFQSDFSNFKYLWVKFAILNKSLMAIVDYLVQNASKFYMPHALLHDQLDGEIFCSLLIGPCMLEYTRIKSANNVWSDPNAEELLQRHKIQSQLNQSITNLNEINSNKSITDSIKTPCKANSILSPKEYVESLHQNLKTQLIYGKNNVVVNKLDNSHAGYLSLHLGSNYSLILKWTPNEALSSVDAYKDNQNKETKRSCWKDSIQIDMHKIAYLHCHQEENDSDSRVILVAKDGVQHSPILFPRGSHLVQFLTCLENGLNPMFKIYPSTWESIIEQSVFSIVLKIKSITHHHNEEAKPRAINFELSPIKEMNDDKISDVLVEGIDTNHDLKNLCDTMRRRIMSRAFNGWLEYHRYKKRVKNDVSGLVNLNSDKEIVEKKKKNALNTKINYYLKSKKKLDETLWNDLIETNDFDKKCFYKVIYYNGIENVSLRKKVWPYLLDHYTFEMSKEELKTADENARENYNKLMSDWKVAEEFILAKNEKKSNDYSLLSASTADKTPQSVYKKRDDSGIFSDMFSASFSSPRSFFNSTSWSFSPGEIFKSKEKSTKLQRKNSKKSIKSISSRSLNANFNLLKHAQTPISITNAPETSTENKTFFSKKLESRKTKTSNFFSNLFSGKTIFSKLTSSQVGAKNKDKPTVEETLRTPQPNKINKMNYNRGKYDQEYIDFTLKELAQLLVSNAFLRAIDQLSNEDDQLQSNNKLFEINQLSMIENNPNNTIQTASPSPLCDCSYIEPNSEADSNFFEISNENSKDSSLFSPPPVITPDSEESSKSGYKPKANITKKASILVKDRKNLKNIYKLPLSSRQKKDQKNMNKSISFSITSPQSIKSSTTSLKQKSFLENKELIDNFTLNMHRIDKDVARCDRNHWYFANNDNLKKLQNVIYTYVWENLKVGYQQGMCDIAAPLLVVLDDEALVYSCYNQIMKRMSSNFIFSTSMDKNFTNMCSLIQILDSQLYEHMSRSSDHDQFYFCYRWFLLDFKREFLHDDVQNVWETIWTAKHVSSNDFCLFIATALVETYRDIIIDNNMEFTDIIKFFNEMAEKHNSNECLNLARSLAEQLKSLLIKINSDQ